MSMFKRISSAAAVLVFLSAGSVGAWWLITHRTNAKTADKPVSSANVAKIVKEEDLNTVALSEEAEKRIGLKLAAIEKRSARRVRVYGGEVTVPVGKSILVAAPLGGTLKAPQGGEFQAGQTVKAGSAVFFLTPLLTPEGRATLSASLAETEGQVNNAKTQLELTKIAYDRAVRVLKEGAGSQRQVDEAHAAYHLARKTLDAAIARQAILNKVVGDAEAGTAAPIPIESPEDGLLRTILARPGQNVPTGAALFEVIDIATVWVRVPLPVGDLESIDRTAPGQVGTLSAPPSASLPIAKPIAAPPSANPLSATVDVFYEMDNTQRKLIPGQRLGISIPLADAELAKTVPWSAVVFDIHGGTWVYEQISPRRYDRRRVTVAYSVGPDAVLATGPAVGTQVVIAGVQELFGAETGFVK